jgi:alpha-tubulin suppressor-like RCC1 family protein
MTTVSSPVQIGAKTNANAIGKIVTTSSGTTAILDGIGRVYTLGSGTSGQLGDNTVTNKSTPTLVTLGSFGRTASILNAGYTNFAAVDTSQSLYTWGLNSGFQLGDGTTINKSTPTQTTITKTIEYTWKSITQGGLGHYAAIRTTDGALFTWGINGFGQLGDGTTITRSTPTKIGNNSWSIVSAGRSHTAAIDITGALFTWGGNSLAQLGDNTTVSKSSPVKIGTSSWTSISAGENHTAAMDIDGKIYAWGYNVFGQVGYLTSESSYSNPTKIPSEITRWNWKDFSANDDGTLSAGITTTGGLYAWGLGTSGQLGDNTVVSKSSPVKIGSRSWSKVSTGGAHIAAIDINGTLYAWGLGTSGQLGDNTIVSKSSPVQIASGTSWTFVSAGTSHTTAIDTTGKLYAWGLNTSGQLGDGTAVSKSAPVIIGIPTTYSVFMFPPSQQLSVPNSANYNFGTTPFTVEMWFNSADARNAILASYWNTSNALRAWQIGVNSSMIPFVNINGVATTLLNSAVTIVSWNHLAFVGNGTTMYLYLNGVSQGTPIAQSFTSVATDALWIGQNGEGGTNQYHGYISNFRIVKGTAVYTSNFTPPITPLTAVANTVLLTCNSGTIVDNSGLNVPVTVVGGAPVSRFVPLNTNASWTAISAGASHTTAIDTLGNLYTWGFNSTNQLGDGTTISKTTPVQIYPSNISTWKKVSIDYSHALAIRNSDSSLWTWGLNNAGQLGDGTTINKSTPIKIGNSSWAQVAGNGSFSMAIDVTGALYTWGQNNNGQLGSGTTINRSSPVQIGTSSWSVISAGDLRAAAIDINGQLYLWGFNTQGQLGDGTTINKSSPVKIGASSWTSVTTGFSHSVGLTIDKSLFTWGFNSTGQLGDGTTINKSSPVKIGTSSWTIAGAMHASTGAIDITGALYVWGLNASGQIGDGTTINKSSPVKIGSSSWTFVAPPDSNTMAIRIDGALFAWGNNGGGGGLGDGTTVNKSSPVKIGSSSWTTVGTGGGINHSFGIFQNGTLYTWGMNNFGNLGDTTTVNKSSPVQVTSVVDFYTSSWTSVSAGLSHTQGILSDGKLYAWGGNATGQIGDGTTVNKSVPIQVNVTGPNIWILSAASGGISGTSTSAGIDNTGALWTWGFAGTGWLGDNTVVAKSSPVKIGTSSWAVVSAGDSHMHAIDSQGRLYAWGNATQGRLGHNLTGGSANNRSSPVQIGTSSWVTVASNALGGKAIDINGRLFSWGYGAAGAVGDNAAVDRSSPVLIGNSSWSMVAAGADNYYQAYAITSTKELYAWGYNTLGQIGDGTTITKSSPVKIGTSSWSFISNAGNHAAGITIDGGLWTWGFNTQGQLGDGTTIAKSSPVKIGTSSWSVVGGSENITAAIDINGRLFTWGSGSI